MDKIRSRGVSSWNLMVCISNFRVIRPRFESLQEKTLDWLFCIHAETEKESPEFCLASLQETIDRVGCKKEHIAKRGHMVPDYLHKDFEAMHIYNVRASKQGASLSARSSFFEAYADEIFENYYPVGSKAPDDLIHVSCTGYVSPSGAQKIVSKRGWQTTVTHAYHMGCYAAIPAVRIARGFLSYSDSVDVVHTEICSLHTHPSDHRKDQLLSQALFADGFIKYSIHKKAEGPHFRLLGVREEILRDSMESMTWKVGAHGFEMVLLKEIPVLLTRALTPFVKALCSEYPLQDALFAIHPGGPKILQYAQKELSLTDAQMRWSYHVLKECGNMSSATLPHVWDCILKDESIPSGSVVVSLAFGPGLTVVGSIMEKVCG
jgi:predicted naringenin-chalcone synthase